MIKPGNLYKELPPGSFGEWIQPIAETPSVRVERIVSRGQASPPGFWYDQDMNEYVVVIQGKARLRVQGIEDAIELATGDYISLPAHCRHRVEWTDPAQTTIWLAVHFIAD